MYMHHAGRQQEHERQYERTINHTISQIEAKGYSENAIPRIIKGLQEELAQCIDLLLISPQFYEIQMERLSSYK